MAGFLTHLVQRTLAPSPALAPRLSGRYEALREASTAGFEGDAPELSDEAAPVQQPVRAQSEALTMRTAADAQPLQLQETDTDPAARAREFEVPAATSAMLDPAETKMPERADAAPPSADNAEEGIPALPTSVPTAPAAFLAPAPRELTVKAMPARKTEPRAQAQPRSVETHVPTRNAGAALPADAASSSRACTIPAVDVSPPPRSRGAHAGLLIDPRLPIHAEPRREPVQAPAAPTVHVTIGRIELRAAAAATAPVPSRAAAKSPALSLSDYLERRAKRGTP